MVNISVETLEAANQSSNHYQTNKLAFLQKSWSKFHLNEALSWNRETKQQHGYERGDTNKAFLSFTCSVLAWTLSSLSGADTKYVLFFPIESEAEAVEGY